MPEPVSSVDAMKLITAVDSAIRAIFEPNTTTRVLVFFNELHAKGHCVVPLDSAPSAPESDGEG